MQWNLYLQILQERQIIKILSMYLAYFSMHYHEILIFALFFVS